jgi:hypothetical protein
VLVAAVAVAVIAAGIVLVAARPHGHQTASRAGSTATARAPTSRASAPARTPSSSAAQTPAASRSASSAPTPTPSRSGSAGTTPGDGSGGGSGAVPAGYYRFTNPTGFSIGVPSGWQISHVGHYVYVRDPADSGVFLLIDQSDQPRPDPLADWRQQAAARQGSYPGYHLIELRAVRYPQAEKAADWEFTYVRNGVTVQVLNRNILANAHHAYALYWSTPASQWNADYHYFQVFAATFRPAAP